MADSPVSIVRLKGVRRKFRGVPNLHRLAALVVAVLLAASNAIHAEEAIGVKSFDIPAQSLSQALTTYARQAGVQIFYPTSPAQASKSFTTMARPLCCDHESAPDLRSHWFTSLSLERRASE